MVLQYTESNFALFISKQNNLLQISSKARLNVVVVLIIKTVFCKLLQFFGQNFNSKLQWIGQIEREEKVENSEKSKKLQNFEILPMTNGQFEMSFIRLRPYHVENTPSRPIWQVKQRWARLVLGSETSWESRVL